VLQRGVRVFFDQGAQQCLGLAFDVGGGRAQGFQAELPGQAVTGSSEQARVGIGVLRSGVRGNPLGKGRWRCH